MKNILFFILLIIMLVACNKPEERFDDNLIEIQLINIEKLNSEQIYSLKIKNKGNFILKHSVLYMSFPIKVTNGTKSNPFKIEAKTNGISDLMNPGDEVYYTVFAPFEEVFTDITAIEIENPTIEFKGFYLNGKDEIPFGIARTTSVLD